MSDDSRDKRGGRRTAHCRCPQCESVRDRGGHGKRAIVGNKVDK